MLFISFIKPNGGKNCYAFWFQKLKIIYSSLRGQLFKEENRQILAYEKQSVLLAKGFDMFIFFELIRDFTNLSIVIICCDV